MFGSALVLAFSPDAKATVEAAEEKTIRAVKIVVEKETLVEAATVPASDSLEDDFVAIQAILDDSPCIVLVRLEGTKWALVAYTPDAAPVKKRMMNASSVKPVQNALEKLTFLEYQITEKSEVTLKGFQEATHVMSEEEKRDCMTREERQIADVKKQQIKEQIAAPKMLAGLKNLAAKEQESFTEAMKIFKESEGKALVASLTGPKGEQLSGKILDDIASPAALKGGKLPTDVSCYVLVKKEAPKLLFITWQPEDVGPKLKMSYSTFKASVMEIVQEALPDAELLTANPTEEDELTDDMGNARRVTADDTALQAAVDSSPTGGGGYKPPCGGIKMPGMGGPR